jgi:hypothetical protein
MVLKACVTGSASANAAAPGHEMCLQRLVNFCLVLIQVTWNATVLPATRVLGIVKTA